MAEELVVDLTQYKDRVGQRVAPGRYKVIVDDTEQDTAKSGNTMINLWLRVMEGEFKDAVIIDRLVLTPNSLFRVVGFMQAIGLPTPKKRVKINLRQFLNQVLLVDVEDGDPYNGRVKSEVRGYERAKDIKREAPADLPDDDDDAQTGAGEGGLSEFENRPIDAGEPPAEVDLDKLDLG